MMSATPSMSAMPSTDNMPSFDQALDSPVSPSPSLRPFYVISLSYLLFTLTDGALRMIVLMQANDIGFSAFEIALMFVLYELCGVVTNLLGGVLASRLGLRTTLLCGLVLQCVACGLLMPFSTPADWQHLGSRSAQIAYIMFTQSFAGMAKDLVKLSGKSVTKLASPQGDNSRLFYLVSRLTGFKNEVKGLGFFVGTALQRLGGFIVALSVLGVVVLLAIVPSTAFLSPTVGRSRGPRINWHRVFHKGADFNLLCAARLFLFGSRDIWFEVALPIYMKNILGWDTLLVGCFLAGWTVVYGLVQSYSKELALQPLKQFPPEPRHAWPWASVLSALATLVAAGMTGVRYSGSSDAATGVIITGLALYAILFAVNSSTHSYLVVLLSDHDKVAMDVGFYYMANAAGRLLGTLLGGVLYSFYDVGDSQLVLSASGNYTLGPEFDWTARTASFSACLWGAAVLGIISTVFGVVMKRVVKPAGSE
ncbi:major facilitator transporter [Capsaspora owczarzaki ATCC 30864]|uniref:Major facilitator transporter n=1 Tax=Capsaspora owczarzaki (strain ATCC 30864) TaxID=595528 RepID=A0A0D2X352_CAPO3|nr:major facilitator transporter [Capsaspora owczarzaki ATCC 30864]KJE93704.1 major facilitator transporter [Capsaspora owczarzaki ATCC 30864]|eukprot:XP_004348286.2 major facilitator transporter [Capsaspora owczarzaki ATCC 30864]